MERKRINYDFVSRSEKKFYVFVNGLQIATISYSDATKSWYARLWGLSDMLYETNEFSDAERAVMKGFEDWLEGIWEEE